MLSRRIDAYFRRLYGQIRNTPKLGMPLSKAAWVNFIASRCMTTTPAVRTATGSTRGDAPGERDERRAGVCPVDGACEDNSRHRLGHRDISRHGHLRRRP